MALHLIKLAVGVDDLGDLRRAQKERKAERGKWMHATRFMPKRAEELLDGGSIFWVIRGQILARQVLKGFSPFVGRNGNPRTAIEYAPKIIPVMPTPHRPFQGWRYLTENDAPKDRPAGVDAGEHLPPKLAKELRELGLL